MSEDADSGQEENAADLWTCLFPESPIIVISLDTPASPRRGSAQVIWSRDILKQKHDLLKLFGRLKLVAAYNSLWTSYRWTAVQALGRLPRGISTLRMRINVAAWSFNADVGVSGRAERDEGGDRIVVGLAALELRLRSCCCLTSYNVGRKLSR